MEDRTREIILKILNQRSQTNPIDVGMNADMLKFMLQKQYPKFFNKHQNRIKPVLEKLIDTGQVKRYKFNDKEIYKISKEAQMGIIGDSETKEVNNISNQEFYDYLLRKYNENLKKSKYSASYYLLQLMVQKYYEEDYDKAEKLIDKFKVEETRKSDDPDFPNISYYPRYYLSKAILYLGAERLYTKMKAQPILEKLISLNGLDFDSKSISLRQYCKLLVLEFKATENKKLIPVLQDYAKNLKEIGEFNKNIEHEFYSLTLQAKLHLISGDISSAEQMYSQIEEELTNLESSDLKQLITNEIEQFKLQIRDWHNLIDSSKGLYERFRMAQIEEYIEKAKTMAVED